MGDIYLAEDVRLNRRAAIKVLPPSATTDPERVLRLHQEARSASALNHPNIITIYDIGEASGVHFIATEYIDGDTLRQRITAGMSLTEALDVAIQIGEAISAAHDVFVVHRDLKPENVMIRRDGYVKVLDFGLAKLTDSNSGGVVSRLTEPGRVMGTVQYMSPEQVLGYPVDARTDVFSIGLLLYEMITGKQAFNGFTRADIVAAILGKEPEPVRDILPSVPSELESVIARAVQKDRQLRYQTAADLVTDLRRIRSGMSATTQSDPAASTEPRVAASESKQWSEIAATARAYSSSRSAPAGLTPSTRRWWLTVALATVITVAAVSWMIWNRGGARIDSVAVLPFTNASGNADHEYLSDGLTDSLIHTLSRIPKLRVMARSTVYHYKGKELDPRQVGKDLNVRAVLDGRVLTRGDVLIVQADLVDARDGGQLWGDEYKVRLADVATLQTDIAREISERLRLRLTGSEKSRLEQQSTSSPEAYQLYLKGRYFWNKRTAPDYRKAISYFKQATDVDANYSLAYAGLADTYNLLGSYGEIAPREAFPRARASAIRALELDPDLAEAHTSLAYALQNFYWDWSGAEREYKRAVALNPSYATTFHWYGGYLMLMGRFDEAIKMRAHARELDPLSPSIQAALGSPYLLSRQYDQAIRMYLQSLELEPNFSHAYLGLGWSYLGKGLHHKAIELFEKGTRMSGGDPSFSSELGYAYAVAGRQAQARELLERLIEERQSRHVSSFEIAMIYAGLGEEDKAFEWLERAYSERSNRLTGIKVEPTVDRLRTDPRFDDLLRRMKLADAG